MNSLHVTLWLGRLKVLGRFRAGLVSGVWVLVLFVALFGVVLNVPVVRASGTIYIRADGSIDPQEAPISTIDNVTYTFTDNINDSIVVERDNIAVDGAGYTVQGTGAEYSVGIDITYTSNVAIRNVRVTNFHNGIWLSATGNSNIENITATNNFRGILLDYYSSNNIIVNNTLSLSKQGGIGILLYYSSSNRIANNTVSNNDHGIWLYYSDYNTLSDNAASNNGPHGIWLYYSKYNTLVNNTASSSSHSGIELAYSSYNSLSGNIFSNNGHNFGAWGESVSDYYNYVDTSNAVDGKPIYYFTDVANAIIDAQTNAGTVYLINCNNITIKDLTLTKNYYGIFLCNTADSKIENITASYNLKDGIHLAYSSNNMLVNNTASNNYWFGIWVGWGDNNMLIGNAVSNNEMFGGIAINEGNNNIVSDNTALNEYPYGIGIGDSNYTTISSNRVLNNRVGASGIFIRGHDNVICNNIVTFNEQYGKGDCGIYLHSSGTGNTVVGNTVSNNNVGIYPTGGNSRIFHNNFINNTMQVDEWASQNWNSIWDDSYPSGGNYWDDYNGTDLYSGPYQNETGSDGIGDTPYIISVNNKDNYPLMKPLDTKPPITLHDYGGLWHTIKFTINLSATDETSGVAETYYRINNGPIQNVTANGQPLITTEDANNTLEYWSVDNADNEELPHKILTGIKLDKTYPTIETPSRTPDGDVLPDQSVKVSVNVTDALSQVKNVTLFYTTDNGNTWTDLPMNNTVSNLYEATIPGQEADTTVRFEIAAYDCAGNNATLHGTEPYCTYQVIPEFPPNLVLPIFMIATLLAIIVYKRKKTSSIIDS